MDPITAGIDRLMISIQGLTYSYNPQKKISFQDFAIQNGEHWLLLGQSGSGKTTLLHLLGGLLKSQEGSILVNDTELTKLSEAALDRFRGKYFDLFFRRII